MKKGGLLWIGCLFLVALAVSLLVAADPGVQDVTDIAFVGTSRIYEYQTANVTILFSFNNATVLNDLSLAYSGVNVSAVKVPTDPTIFNTSQIVWQKDAQSIQLTVSGISTTTNIAYDWTVSTNDSKGNKFNKVLTFIVDDDSIAPNYTRHSPSSFAFLPNGSVVFNISVTDRESGFDYANVHYEYVNAVGSKSESTLSASLGCGATCYAAVDRQASGILGYYYNVTDRAGNRDASNWSAASWYYLYVDTQSPNIGNLSPAEGAIISSTTQNYGFNFSDDSFVVDNANFNPTMNCTVFINGSRYNSTIYDETKANTPLALGATLGGLADGYYNWQVTCKDNAGWSTSSSARSFTLDNTGPIITLTHPADGTTNRNGTIINFTITDFPSGVSRTVASLNGGANDTLSSPYHLDTSTWASGSNEMVVFANDTIGNPSKKTFSIIIDNTAPTMALQQPANNSFGSGTFTATARDDFSSTLSCSIQVDGSVRQTKAVTNGSTGSFSASLTDGNHGWLVNCTDEVGNTASSESWNVVIDTEKPAIVLAYPLNNLAYDQNNLNTAGISNFNYSPSDNIAVGSCQLFVNNILKTALNGNLSAFNFSESSRNDPYLWQVQCNDTAGNIQNSSSSYVYYDTTAPTISSLAHSTISDQSAIISWTIDEKANNTVYVGINKTLLLADPASHAKVSNVTGTPQLLLSSLSASTTYFYLAVSCDQFGQCSNTSATIDTASFTTSAAPVAPNGGGGGGGGGGGTTSNPEQPEQLPQEFGNVECDPSWHCTEWSACTDGQQTRTCQDWSLCGVTEGKPEEVQACAGSSSTAVEEGQAGSEQQDGATDNPLGVGQATGIFSQITANWKPISAALGLIALLGLTLWKGGPVRRGMSKVFNYRQARRDEEEAAIREKLRQQGLL